MTESIGHNAMVDFLDGRRASLFPELDPLIREIARLGGATELEEIYLTQRPMLTSPIAPTVLRSLRERLRTRTP